MRVFVDTGAWFALNCRSDQHHEQAVGWIRRYLEQPVHFHTTDNVVDETLTLLRLKVSHRDALHFLDFLESSPSVSRVMVSGGTLRTAEAIFRRFDDKRWSFTDCVSFAVMDSLELDAAFTFDHNFEQYGKRRLPDPSAS